MSKDAASLFWLYNTFVILVFLCGIYLVAVTKNLIKVLIGLELLTKAATLLIIVAGYSTGHIATAQALIINLIVVEVVVIAVAAGVVLSIRKKYGSLNVKNISNLKG
ncbi:MAG: NADH-quinone oxidoreductase subunit K [Firmicutes bacterium]|nr:NADH-quinone oxidoreductase subunit K [Bacillota bacterium]